MKNSRDLILGRAVYISIIYRILDSGLYSLNGYDFSFDHMSVENREYNEAEVFSLSIANPNGRPMLPFDWLIHSSLI